MRIAVLTGVTLAVAIAMFLMPPIRQDPAYHRFADQRALLGIPHCLDVLSNGPFLLVGLAGLGFLWRQGSHFVDARERWPWAVFFAGVALTAFGSAYYHLAPDNARLVWDRLPMTLGFMGVLAAMVAERIGVGAGLRLLAPLVIAGALSVAWWRYTEMHGREDLRAYALVQFYGIAAVLLVLALFPAKYTRGGDVLAAVGFYALAKILETLDASIFSLGQAVSGHTLKHLAAAFAAFWLLRMVRVRRPACFLGGVPRFVRGNFPLVPCVWKDSGTIIA
jgi:hypothetical protein